VKGFYVTYQQYFGYDCTGPDSSMVLMSQINMILHPVTLY